MKFHDKWKTIGYKWVLRKKNKVNGSMDKYKVRLVVEGFTQQPGVDFVGTYLPVAEFDSVKIILSIMAMIDLELHQFRCQDYFPQLWIGERHLYFKTRRFSSYRILERSLQVEKIPIWTQAILQAIEFEPFQEILEIGFEVSVESKNFWPITNCHQIHVVNLEWPIIKCYMLLNGSQEPITHRHVLIFYF